MSTSCKGLREELIQCLQQCECVREHGKTVKECLQRDAPGVTSECRALQSSYFECRRGMLDMRNRFRGTPGY